MAFTNPHGRTQSSLADINVTPLVDVVLVLLIIFMLTAPVLQSGIDVSVPKTKTVKEITEERWHRFMAHQQAISKKRLKCKVGTQQQVIIDEVGPTVAKGRSRGDAPEIDGAVYVKSKRPLRVGEFVTVEIKRADEYDLHGTAVGS